MTRTCTLCGAHVGRLWVWWDDDTRADYSPYDLAPLENEARS